MLMAGRPPKQGLDYAAWDVNILDNEPKIDKLMMSHGCFGFVTYFYLCQKAYGFYGYYYPWSFSDCPTTARKVGGGLSAETVESTVGLCLRIRLFDNDRFERYGILTSRGIQKRYMQAVAKRDRKDVITEYWLLEKEESGGLNKVRLETITKNEKPISGTEMPITGEEMRISGEGIVSKKVKKNISNDIYPYSPHSGGEADDGHEDALTALRDIAANDDTESPAPEDDGFDTFWAAYPRKVDKQNAQKKWQKLKPDAALRETIMNALARHKVSRDWVKDNGQFIPYPSTWINKKRWEDEITEGETKNGRTRKAWDDDE
jgi:hypothetical protein